MHSYSYEQRHRPRAQIPAWWRLSVSPAMASRARMSRIKRIQPDQRRQPLSRMNVSARTQARNIINRRRPAGWWSSGIDQGVGHASRWSRPLALVTQRGKRPFLLPAALGTLSLARYRLSPRDLYILGLTTVHRSGQHEARRNGNLGMYAVEHTMSGGAVCFNPPPERDKPRLAGGDVLHALKHADSAAC